VGDTILAKFKIFGYRLAWHLLNISGTEEVKKYAILTKKKDGEEEDTDSDDDDYDREDREISFVHDVRTFYALSAVLRIQIRIR